MSVWIDHEGPDNDGNPLADAWRGWEMVRIYRLTEAVRAGRLTLEKLQTQDVEPVRRALAEAA